MSQNYQDIISLYSKLRDTADTIRFYQILKLNYQL